MLHFYKLSLTFSDTLQTHIFLCDKTIKGLRSLHFRAADHHLPYGIIHDTDECALP